MKKTGLLLLLSLVISSPIASYGEMKENSDSYLLSAKSCPYYISFPKKGFGLQLERHRPDGNADYYYFTSGENNFNVSFFIEPVNKCKGSEECRDLYWSNPGPLVKNPERVSKYGRNRFAIVEYYLPLAPNKEAGQMHVSGHMVEEGYWVDMHLSRVIFNKKFDNHLFDSFIQSISVKQK